MANPLRATTTFFWGQRCVREGDIVSDEDPVVIKHRALFEAVVVPSVEQATAAPGERRTLTRPPRK